MRPTSAEIRAHCVPADVVPAQHGTTVRQHAAALEEVRPGAEAHIHFEHLDYIDHACLDLLSSWERQHETTGGSLIIEWEELSSKFHQRRVGAKRFA